MPLYQGDCMEAMRRLKRFGKKVHLTVCDVPFGVNFNNSKHYNDRFNVVDRGTEWLEQVYDLHYDDTFIFLYVGSKTIHHWINAMEAAGFTYVDTIAAQTFTNGNYNKKGFDNSFQPIIYGVKGKKRDFNKVDFIPTSEAWMKDKRNEKKNPFTYNYPNFIPRDICPANVKPNAQRKLSHPNEKNVDMLQFLIELTTTEGEWVFDFAMGSGSTCVAAKRCGRNFIGVDLDQDYFDIAMERLSNE